MNKRQQSKIESVGRDCNMSKQDAMKAYLKICEHLKNSIASTPKQEDGTYNPEDFKTIHIYGLGKFVPNKLKIININKALLMSKKRQQNGNTDSTHSKT